MSTIIKSFLFFTFLTVSFLPDKCYGQLYEIENCAGIEGDNFVKLDGNGLKKIGVLKEASGNNYVLVKKNNEFKKELTLKLNKNINVGEKINIFVRLLAPQKDFKKSHWLQLSIEGMKKNIEIKPYFNENRKWIWSPGTILSPPVAAQELKLKAISYTEDILIDSIYITTDITLQAV